MVTHAQVRDREAGRAELWLCKAQPPPTTHKAQVPPSTGKPTPDPIAQPHTPPSSPQPMLGRETHGISHWNVNISA